MRHKKADLFFRVTIPFELVSLRIVMPNARWYIERGGQWQDVTPYVAGSATFQRGDSPYEHDTTVESAT